MITTDALGLVPPRVPWTAPFGVALTAVLVWVLARSTYRRIQERRQRVEPQRAVAYLVLGKATALGGALVAAGYLVFGVLFVSQFEIEASRARVIRSGVTVLAGVALALGGLRLERACKVPDDDRDDRDPAD